MRRPRATLGRRRSAGSLLLASLTWLGTGTAAADEGNAVRAPAPPAAFASAGEDPASADEGRVVELNERGSALYADGDYRRAVELFLQAYAVGSDPNLLFNIAACYEGLGDRDAAIEKYRAFLADPSADPDGRPRAASALERLLSNDGNAAPPQAPIAPTSVELRVPPAAALAGPTTDAPPEWVPWAVLGGGAALSVTGVAIYLLGAADHREVTEAPGYDDPDAVVPFSREHAEALVDSGNAKKVMGASTAAVGGAVIAGYVLWRVLDRPGEPAVAGLGMALSPSAASLSLSGRF